MYLLSEVAIIPGVFATTVNTNWLDRQDLLIEAGLEAVRGLGGSPEGSGRHRQGEGPGLRQHPRGFAHDRHGQADPDRGNSAETAVEISS